jgi:hypothetical protein
VADVVARLTAALADRYTIERELGRGATATVYVADDVKHHRTVAIKVLRPELAAVLGRDRFLREVEIAARLNHPHILALHDSGEADGFLFYVMPYVAGESLRQKLQREKQLAVEDALRITRDVASALGHATLGWAYLKKGMVEQGLAELQTAVSLSPGHTLWLAQLAQAYGMVGNVQRARRSCSPRFTRTPDLQRY